MYKIEPKLIIQAYHWISWQKQKADLVAWKNKIVRRWFSNRTGDFPDSQVVKTPHFQSGGMDLIPGQGTQIPHAMHHGIKEK